MPRPPTMYGGDSRPRASETQTMVKPTSTLLRVAFEYGQI